MKQTLVYDQRGRGFPILCLHGHPGNRQCMEIFTDRLSRYSHTITPDLRGYGDSSTQRPFQMSDHLSDLEHLIHQLNLSQIIVLGWSLGGILGTELALRIPNQVRGLILVASAAHPTSTHPPISGGDYFYTALASIFNRINSDWAWNREQLGRRSLYRYLIQTHTSETYRYLAKYGWPAFFKTSKFANDALNQALVTRYNRTQVLDQISCPSLVLAGECDRHIATSASLETYRHLPSSTWICYPNTAHLFPWEIPLQVTQDIEQWLFQQFPETFK